MRPPDGSSNDTRKPKAHEPKVWFTSTESFAKVLSKRNCTLLAVISATHLASLQYQAISLVLSFSV